MNSSTKPRSFRRKLIPSPSMAVALLALTIAMTGTAWAAVTINGKNIKKGTVTSKQIKDKSLTGRDVKDKSLTGTDVSDGSIANADLGDGSVTASKLAAGAVATPPPPNIGTVTSTTGYSPPVSLTYSDIPGVALDYTAPAGTTKLVLTFSAECDVNTTSNSQFIGAQIVVDGSVAAPDDAANQFCTVDPLDNYSQIASQSITRVIAAGPGTHAIKAQAVALLLTNGTLDNMTLTVVPSS